MLVIIDVENTAFVITVINDYNSNIINYEIVSI
jgi:hypothetical protein